MNRKYIELLKDTAEDINALAKETSAFIQEANQAVNNIEDSKRSLREMEAKRAEVLDDIKMLRENYEKSLNPLRVEADMYLEKARKTLADAEKRAAGILADASAKAEEKILAAKKLAEPAPVAAKA